MLLPIIDVNVELNEPYECGFNASHKTNNLVPINYSIKTKLIWFEGLCDSNKTDKTGTNKTDIKIKHTNLLFLQQVQLMLTTLGINSNIEHNILTVNSIKELHNLGFRSKLFDKLVNNNVDKINEPIYIVSIEKLNGIHKTYCFNEPKEHAGIFNGILTGQSEVYSLMIDNIVRDVDEKCRLFNAIKEYPCIAKKALWAQKWIESNAPFSQRLIAFTIVEGIFFSGSFCAIFWLKKKNCT